MRRSALSSAGSFRWAACRGRRSNGYGRTSLNGEINRLKNTFDAILQFAPSCCSGVTCQHNFTGPRGDPIARCVIDMSQRGDDIFGVIGNQDSLAVRQQFIEVPPSDR